MNTRTDVCARVPYFDRLNYFYGQLLGARDFRLEQDFFREKLRLHNRCLHGYGVVCGLEVRPCGGPVKCPDPVWDPHGHYHSIADTPDPKSARAGQTAPHDPVLIRIDCGFALDCDGNELVVRSPIVIDIRDVHKGDATRPLYVTLCYCEHPIEPVRPVVTDACGGAPCAHGKVRETVRVRVTREAPADDDRCDPCCEPCTSDCVLLARIDPFDWDVALTDQDVHNEVRRYIGEYTHAVVTGISWKHGGAYTEEEAAKLLDHVEVRFSRPIQVDTVRDGVCDLWVIEGGRGRHAGVNHIDALFVDLPADGMTDRVILKQTTGEGVEDGDRVLVTLRTGFLLDACCRHVAGAHCGRVPVLPDFANLGRATAWKTCDHPPGRFAPWTSGPGPESDRFESWFFVKPLDKTDPGHKQVNP
jgi:hypothetical protein